MTKDEILGMAKEAGIKACIGKTDKDGKYHPFVNALGKDVPIEWLERFAALVAEKEREECAKVCEELVPDMSRTANDASVWDVATFDCAAAIRAEGQNT